ncbi:MFS transporter, putative [Bodo saltans]|uniref:MFS transporter, putative n=1 Tax=Bodo saltans TaxID=75058 RepID=A0A0S4JIF3_BODSA|nr:MFS transporter, putative [Bodo saltans]|eukprot:CUG89704.1 MFS transporter, putative [Bodo saltans]
MSINDDEVQTTTTQKQPKSSPLTVSSPLLRSEPSSPSPGAAELHDVRPLDHPSGYLIATAAMLTQVCVFGTGYALSTFISVIEKDPTLDYAGESLIALASGINFGMGPFIGALSGYLSDVFGPRRIVMFAAVCHCLALNLASLARTRAEFVIAYGPLMGAAFGCMVTPGSHATSSYFDRHRSIAMGVNYAGGGAGSALIPHIAAVLLVHYNELDWRPAMRWMSLLSLGCFIPALILTKRASGPQQPPAASSSPTNDHAVGDDHVKHHDVVDVNRDEGPTVWEMVKTRRFISLFFVAVFFGYAFYSSVFNWVPFAKAQGKFPYADRTSIDLDDATHVTIAFGVVQAVGNVLLGVAASSMNPHHVYVFSTLLASAAIFAWPWCRSITELMVVASFAGLGAAGARTIFPALIANHFPAKVGSMMGVAFLGYGVGGLIGPPITSALITARDGRFDLGLSVMASSCLVSALIYIFAVPPPVHDVGAISGEDAVTVASTER